jgi:hypothetical protein
MAFDQQLTSFSKKAGLFMFNLVAINPTLSEIEGMGLPFKNEPKYEREDGKIVVDFYLKSEEFPEIGIQKLTFWLENKDKVSQNGNHQLTDKKGRFAYSGTYMDKATVRHAKEGEEQLTNFIQKWLGSGGGFDTIDEIVTGNIGELQALFTEANLAKKVGVLVGIKEVVKDGKINYYFTAYNKQFVSSTNIVNDTKALGIRLADGYGTFKAWFPHEIIQVTTKKGSVDCAKILPVTEFIPELHGEIKPEDIEEMPADTGFEVPNTDADELVF